MAEKSIYTAWIELTRPKWREEYENHIRKLERETGLSERELIKVADAIHELSVFRNIPYFNE